MNLFNSGNLINFVICFAIAPKSAVVTSAPVLHLKINEFDLIIKLISDLVFSN